jgi:hypothetical protein
MNDQRINDQDMFRVVERAHARAHELLCEIHGSCWKRTLILESFTECQSRPTEAADNVGCCGQENALEGARE